MTKGRDHFNELVNHLPIFSYIWLKKPKVDLFTFSCFTHKKNCKSTFPKGELFSKNSPNHILVNFIEFLRLKIG